MADLKIMNDSYFGCFFAVLLFVVEKHKCMTNVDLKLFCVVDKDHLNRRIFLSAFLCGLVNQTSAHFSNCNVIFIL